jgi:ABC-type phosphate transport system permease subunit
MVLGAGFGIHWSLFATGDTLASKIANQYQSADTDILRSSLVYLAGILLIISLLVNLAAQVIVRRFSHQRAGGT